MSKIIGVTVGTPTGPETMRKKMNAVTSINGVTPNEDGNVELNGYAKLSDLDNVAYMATDDNTNIEVAPGTGGGSGGSCTCEGLSGEAWTFLGEATVGNSVEFFPVSIVDGVVTIDPNSSNYGTLDDSRYANNRAVVVRKNIAYRSISADDVTNCFLKPIDYSAGTFQLLNGDAGNITKTFSVDDYKIVMKTIRVCSVSGVTHYNKYRFRCVTPYMCAHGVRTKFGCNMPAFQWPADSSAGTGGVIYEVETFPYMSGSEYVYVKRTFCYSGNYGTNTGTVSKLTDSPVINIILRPVSDVTVPSDGIVTFTCDHGIFAPGMTFQIWGCN